MSTQPTDPHAVLGVSRAATADQITTAYRNLVRALHPDRGDRSPAERQRLADVLAAYQLLRQDQSGRRGEEPRARQPPPPNARVRVRIHPDPSPPTPTEPVLRVGPTRRHHD